MKRNQMIKMNYSAIRESNVYNVNLTIRPICLNIENRTCFESRYSEVTHMRVDQHLRHICQYKKTWMFLPNTRLITRHTYICVNEHREGEVLAGVMKMQNAQTALLLIIHPQTKKTPTGATWSAWKRDHLSGGIIDDNQLYQTSGV